MTILLGLALVLVGLPSGVADHSITDSDAQPCPTTGAVVACEASAFVALEFGRCPGSGCYVIITCSGTATGTGTVAGTLVCGTIDVSGNVDPDVGQDSCDGPPSLGSTWCSMSRFGDVYVYNSSCKDIAAETTAVSPVGTAIARAGPIKVCVDPQGEPFIG